MTWSKNNTISVLALFASCTPIFILLAAHLLRQRRLRAKKQPRLDVEGTPTAPQPQSSQYVWIRREYTLVALILIQRDAHFADRGTWAMRSRYGGSDSSSTPLTPWKDTHYR
ncbi:hypothetical protein CC77DRAFT_1072016 [Alternaria alternata]|uniref:Uncharacterized protein n=1 Tax=Alternaria alternata TaxID=5599 RepID=A0A177DKX4_ALTAL|nr:hypothetical protein CC77DRAFT_1072016 [Alternaria alternata]OAG19958.1 hypothetical protein CC77DRAFT_1072016 [Alternaria alternata]